MSIKKIFAILFFFLAVAAFAQQKPLQTSIDSAKIKIGSQANLTLKATVDTGATVSFPEGKTFGQLEVIESYPIDTLRKGAIYELVKKYGLTQFDSGRFVIPRLPVVINNKTVQSDSLVLEIANIKVDTLQQKMFDIKPIAKADSTVGIWVYILIGILVAAAIAFGVWYYLKNRKKPIKKEKAVIKTPIEKATSQLQDLEKKELLQRGEVKEYYSELADIARTYIEEAIHIPAMESTTGELIEAMRRATQRRKMSLRPETFEQLEQVLRNADLVKFAKSRPMEFEIAEDRSRIEKTIVVIDRSIPVEKEDDEIHTKMWEEAQRKKKEKKRRNQIIGAVAFVISFIVGWLVVDAIMNDSGIFGTPTKELLEGEWVKSEYGNPGIIIETPKVLKRADAEKTTPKDAMAFIKDINSFVYGELFGDIYITVGTTIFKEPKDIDLNLIVEGLSKTWETQGARNILLKTEEFSTHGGIQGIRSFGTMTMQHAITKKPVRAYYEMYLFKQQQGLQQVLVLYKDGDEYAPQILERIKNSIELRNQNQ
ncbi:hypothetical protein FMM05_15880 [Flavobacterium zepuense]|uniref:Oxygen tolerance n=1 Tax=Flavobacterium zepuense TaxID=2593302 RepID=A0A552UWZ0_9FLAO|nr:hypothetical protein [Flavobacterium zepuense]TRW22736.1 hypothetical protein FMM05_15880 [Flavobacterium zepuense]